MHPPRIPPGAPENSPKIHEKSDHFWRIKNGFHEKSHDLFGKVTFFKFKQDFRFHERLQKRPLPAER